MLSTKGFNVGGERRQEGGQTKHTGHSEDTSNLLLGSLPWEQPEDTLSLTRPENTHITHYNACLLFSVRNMFFTLDTNRAG